MSQRNLQQDVRQNGNGEAQSSRHTSCEEPVPGTGLPLSKQLRLRWDAVVQKAKAFQIDIVSDHPFANCSFQASRLQIYFMHAVDFENGAAFPTFFVTNALNTQGRSIAALHSKYHSEVGGLSGTIVPGNKAGYIGGLTGNKAIAEMLYSARPARHMRIIGNRNREKLIHYLIQKAKDHKEFKNLNATEIQKRCEGFVDSEDLSFRDYVDMRTGRKVDAVMKDDIPLFEPSHWEELHSLLRKAAFCEGESRQPQDVQRMFSSSSAEDIGVFEDVTIGNCVECFLVDEQIISRHPRANLSKGMVDAIKRHMKALKLRYCNAVYEDVTSIEDCGFAFFPYP